MSRRTKVCVVMPSHWAGRFGGAEYQVKLLLDSLLELPGVEVCYLARNIAESFSDERYLVHGIGGFPGLRKIGFWTDGISLLRHLRREKPDVIYQRVGCAYTGICGAYARHHDTRLVWHISIDSDLSDDIGRFSNFSRSVERRMRDYGIRQADEIVAQTNDQAATLLARHGKIATVIPNFQPAPCADTQKSSQPTVLWIANLKPAKQPELFLRLAEELSESTDIRFRMIGRGGNLPRYRELIRQASRRDNFEYLGELSVAAVNDQIERSHVLVNTSIDEGFPNTFIQAWYRRAVVVSVNIDPDGIIKKEACGIVADSAGDLVGVVRKILGDQQERQLIAERALKYATEHHSLRNADDLAQLIIRSAS